MALASAQGHWRGQKSLSPLWKARFSLSTPSNGPSYGFPRLKIIISNNIYTIGTLIVKIEIGIFSEKDNYSVSMSCWAQNALKSSVHGNFLVFLLAFSSIYIFTSFSKYFIYEFSERSKWKILYILICDSPVDRNINPVVDNSDSQIAEHFICPIIVVSIV